MKNAELARRICMLAATLNDRAEFRNRVTLANDRGRAAREVADRDVVVVNAEVTVDRGEKIFGTDSALDGVFTTSVGGSDHLARANAAAGKEHGTSSRPVIAAGLHGSGWAARHPATA